jgi:hypothetical protein
MKKDLPNYISRILFVYTDLIFLKFKEHKKMAIKKPLTGKLKVLISSL